MKRNWILALGLIMVMVTTAALAACGPEQPTAVEEPTPVAEPTAAEEPTPATEDNGSEAAEKPTVDGDALITGTGLQYIEIEKGDGPPAEPGKVVKIHYRGSLEDGTEFDNSYVRGEPITFALFRGMVIPGMDEGIGMMLEGGQARLIIPPDLAYGETGAGGVIPPNATLIFEVELVEVLPGSPESPTEVDSADYETTGSGLQYYDLEAGDGSTPKTGELVSVNYTGWLTDGTKFDSSLDRGQTFIFPVGQGQVIPGWDEGVATMKPGGKRQLVIPAELAYGEAGAGAVIPPNASLIFEIELVEILPGSPEAPTEVDAEDYETTGSGLQYYELEEGDGPSPEDGQAVAVHYTGWLTDGTKFDSSLDRGQPFVFVLGQGQVISGWDEGVATMKVGGRRQLVIPPELGYGEPGSGGTIPPNATLIFEVELLEIR